MKIKITLIFLFLLLTISGCSSLLSSAIPNPLKDDKGINTDVQLAKTANMNKKKQLGEINIDATDKSSTSNTAKEISIKNSNIPWWIALMVAFMRPLVILKEIIDLFGGKSENKPRQRTRPFISESHKK